MPTLSRVAVGAGLVVSLVLGGARARASEGDEYDATIKEALAEYDRGLWEEAQILFRRAHKLRPSARTLRGIGVTAFGAQHYVEAITTLQAALQDQRKPLTPQQRAHAASLIERARRFVGRVELRLSPSNASVTVDGREVDTSSGEILLDPGRCEIVAKAPGHETLARRIAVQGGSSSVLELTLQPLDAPPVHDEVAPAAAAVPASPAPQPQHPEDGAAASVLPWVGLAVSGAVGITGGVLLGLGVSDTSTVEDASPGTRWEDIEDAHDRAPTLLTLGGVLLGVGVAGAAVSVALLSSSSRATEQDATWLLTLGGVMLKGRL